MNRKIVCEEVKKKILANVPVSQGNSIKDRLRNPNEVITIGAGTPALKRTLTGTELDAFLLRLPDLKEFANMVVNKTTELKNRGVSGAQFDQELNGYLIKQFGDILPYLNEDYFKQ